MLVNVKLFATLGAHSPHGGAGGPFEVEMPDGGRVSDLIERLKVPQTEAKLVFVNGRSQSPDYQLRDGDDVGIFPPVGGG
jgi:molybdopterin converting factor small subunit